MSRYVCVCVCVAKTNLRSQTEMERLNFASKNWRGLVMDGTTANCCLAPGRRTSTASRGREDMCVYVCVCVEARVAARCWVAPTTLNGNASLGAALHGPTDGGRYVCVVTPAVCVCGLRTEHDKQLRPRRSAAAAATAAANFTRSNWISRTVDPITSVVTRY